MDFYWPEGCRGDNDVDVGKMFEIVEDEKKRLLENLEISPQLMDAPVDLLTVYAIYEVFSIKGEKREESRAWFLERYKWRLIYYLENKNSLPEYRSFVRKLFNDLFSTRLRKEIEKMDLDSYLRDNDDLEPILNVIWWGVEIESWEEFKEIFIKKCRELFPYAERRFDRIWNIKSFNKEIMELFFEEKKKEFLWALSGVIDDEMKIVDSSKEEKVKDLKNKISEWWEIKKLLGVLDLLENWDWKIFIEMGWMIKTFSVFDSENFDMEDYFLKFYVKEVMDRFKNSSDKRNPINNIKQQSQIKAKDELDCYVGKTPVFWEIVRKIPIEKEKIIDSIVEACHLDAKKWKSLKKYLVRLLANWRDCRMSSLNDMFGIEKLSEDVQNYFDNLWIIIKYDYYAENQFKATKLEKLENENFKEIADGNCFENTKELTNDMNTEEESLDPIVVCWEQVYKYNYEVNNEKRLKKQIEELCDTDSSLKQILCVEMQKDSFWNPKKKQGRTYYTIEIGVTWVRFILFKGKEWKFLIDWVYNHDDYAKRVKEMK